MQAAAMDARSRGTSRHSAVLCKQCARCLSRASSRAHQRRNRLPRNTGVCVCMVSSCFDQQQTSPSFPFVALPISVSPYLCLSFSPPSTLAACFTHCVVFVFSTSRSRVCKRELAGAILSVLGKVKGVADTQATATYDELKRNLAPDYAAAKKAFLTHVRHWKGNAHKQPDHFEMHLASALIASSADTAHLQDNTIK